jgi:hypothetical protein
MSDLFHNAPKFAASTASTAPASKTVARFKHLHIDRPEEERVYEIINNRSGACIGCISYYVPWRCYVLETAQGIVWSADCLRDVAGFMEGLKRAEERL